MFWFGVWPEYMRSDFSDHSKPTAGKGSTAGNSVLVLHVFTWHASSKAQATFAGFLQDVMGWYVQKEDHVTTSYNVTRQMLQWYIPSNKLRNDLQQCGTCDSQDEIWWNPSKSIKIPAFWRMLRGMACQIRSWRSRLGEVGSTMRSEQSWQRKGESEPPGHLLMPIWFQLNLLSQSSKSIESIISVC